MNFVLEMVIDIKIFPKLKKFYGRWLLLIGLSPKYSEYHGQPSVRSDPQNTSKHRILQGFYVQGLTRNGPES